MMAATEQTCRTCRHAEWTRTSNGRINPKRYGTCRFPETQIIMPRVAAQAWPPLVRLVIWPSDTDPCPTWERL